MVKEIRRRSEMRNKVVFTAGVLFILFVAMGCNLQTNQPSTVPATPTANQNVTGVFAGVKAAGAGNSTITLQTAGGMQSYSISPNATVSLGGKACSINDLAALQAGNTSYNCTVVYNDQMGVFGVYVTGGTGK
jgi:hypothetical protein